MFVTLFFLLYWWSHLKTGLHFYASSSGAQSTFSRICTTKHFCPMHSYIRDIFSGEILLFLISVSLFIFELIVYLHGLKFKRYKNSIQGNFFFSSLYPSYSVLSLGVTNAIHFLYFLPDTFYVYASKDIHSSLFFSRKW